MCIYTYCNYFVCFLFTSNTAYLAPVVDTSNHPPISLFPFITVIKCPKFQLDIELPVRDSISQPLLQLDVVIRLSFGNGFEWEWQVQLLGLTFLMKLLVLHFFLPLLAGRSLPIFLSLCLKYVLEIMPFCTYITFVAPFLMKQVWGPGSSFKGQFFIGFCKKGKYKPMTKVWPVGCEWKWGAASRSCL